MKKLVFVVLFLSALGSVKAQFNLDRPFSLKNNYSSSGHDFLLSENNMTSNRNRMGGVQKYSMVLIGLQGGGTMSNMMGSTIKGNNFAFGYNGGFFVNIWHQEIVSLHIELNYTQFGMQNKLTTQTITYTEDSAIATTDRVSNNLADIYHSITLPVLARFAFGGDVQFFFDLGPYASYTFLAHEKGDITTQTTIFTGGTQSSTTALEVPVNKDIKTDFNKFDVGATGGLGIKIYTGMNSYKFFPYIFVEARFSYGFLSLVKPYDEQYQDGAPPFAWHTRKVHPTVTRYNITLNAGIGMPL